MGFEFAHIRETEIRQWCQDYFETHAYHYDYQPEKKKRILSKLNEAVVFENFLHKNSSDKSDSLSKVEKTPYPRSTPPSTEPLNSVWKAW